ncbi:hypothetical protein ACEQ8H_007099 [Pleosporales sp. CAS-2024a]
MQLVNSIGERYLWVDALCIIQDSPIMQTTQIAKMDRVYAKALFTIVGASGASSSSGLPGIGTTPRPQAQEIIHLPWGNFYTVIADTTEVGNVLRKCPWAHRAWTMQEQLCSGRSLIITATQAYWKCNTATFLEEVSLERVRATNLEIFHYGSSFRFPTHALNKHGFFRLYSRILASYLQRDMSYLSDRLNAFTGICARLCAIQDDSFLWGIPQSQFSRCLGWQFAHGTLMRHDGQAKIRLRGAYDWHPSGNEFHPVVDFWICNHDALVVPVDEPGMHGHEVDTFDTDFRLAWQGHERRVCDYITALHGGERLRTPGLLYFWSSVVRMRPSRLATTLVQVLLPPQETRCIELRELVEGGRVHGTQCEDVGFVVVARTDELRAERPEKSLLVLTVRWDHGVAYALGSAMVKEGTWMARSDRQWEFVVMG